MRVFPLRPFRAPVRSARRSHPRRAIRLPVIRLSLLLLSLAMLTGCACRQPSAEAGTKAAQVSPAESPLLLEHPATGGMLYSREPELLRRYTKFQVEHVVLREERPETFQGASLDEKAAMVFITHDIFVDALRRGGWEVTDTPGPGVARLRLMIFGMQATEVVPSDAAYDTPFGRIDLSRLDDSGRAALMGNITIGGELTDAETGARLLSYVERCSVTGLDPLRAFGRWDAARSGVEASAASLVRGWNRLHGK
ncbi:DUF3313 domain-containing protein [Nitratidesulfovibrio liaohensis]|uniref:DUF3313 domain-containing protein n=1 Tax=Nitratidesulfovibrio liaohensis TaxID=2604158 RepID=UPI0014207939|nr:DUF3313 domain-containing protein [Nitratidesulfovibrio liaohensis]NHZ46759.1 DUF3313 domain-containing protein [Nitratidesulfovibrio liaohensis]